MKKGINVLSLFDGLSCGNVALERAGIKINNYYASEVDKYAIKISNKNYPGIIQLGDVLGVKGKDLPKIDLLIGGSPCQDLSFAGKGKGLEGDRSSLFYQYVRLLKECKPKYFLLENVRMKQEYQDIISDLLGVQPIKINSSLVSAQNRVRLYWTNIPNVTQPEDKGIVLKDILEDYDTIGEEHFHSDKAIQYMERGNKKWMQAGNRRADRYTQSPDKEKAFTLTANFHKGVPYNYFDDTRATSNETTYRKLTPLECERLQTIPDGYTSGVSNSQRYRMLGNSWTADTIAHLFKGLKDG
tara:strand:- start:12 stop:908 length:897 start_codon:yes stop_codon:yes gene_type:complete